MAVIAIFGTTASAKKMPVPKMYMFGLAAAFTDTIVHFTTIQEVDSTWIDTKNKFLQNREDYSYQLREYMSNKLNMPHRTCMVFFNQNQKKLEKKLLKMKNLYTDPKKNQRHYDMRIIDDSDFHFKSIPYTEPETP